MLTRTKESGTEKGEYKDLVIIVQSQPRPTVSPLILRTLRLILGVIETSIAGTAWLVEGEAVTKLADIIGQERP